MWSSLNFVETASLKLLASRQVGFKSFMSEPAALVLWGHGEWQASLVGRDSTLSFRVKYNQAMYNIKVEQQEEL